MGETTHCRHLLTNEMSMEYSGAQELVHGRAGRLNPERRSLSSSWTYRLERIFRFNSSCSRAACNRRKISRLCFLLRVMAKRKANLVNA